MFRNLDKGGILHSCIRYQATVFPITSGGVKAYVKVCFVVVFNKCVYKATGSPWRFAGGCTSGAVWKRNPAQSRLGLWPVGLSGIRAAVTAGLYGSKTFLAVPEEEPWGFCGGKERTGQRVFVNHG